MELLPHYHASHADAHAIKTKLEQEAVVFGAKRAESNSSLIKVKVNIEIFRQQLDEVAKRRTFCLNANDCYNELERLYRLEQDFKHKKVHYGCTNAEERDQQLEQERVKAYETRLYKISCVAARQYQQERNDIWSHLETLIQQRETLKAEVQDTNQLLLLLRRATGSGGGDGSDGSDGGDGSGGGGGEVGVIEEGADAMHSESKNMGTVQQATMRHARQLSSGDREMWETTTLSTKQDTIQTLKFTQQELSDLRKRHRDDPQWLKMLTLIKLKQEVDERIENGGDE